MRNKTRLIGIALSTHTALMSPSQEQELQRLESSWGPSGSGEAGDAGRVARRLMGYGMHSLVFTLRKWRNTGHNETIQLPN